MLNPEFDFSQLDSTQKQRAVYQYWLQPVTENQSFVVSLILEALADENLEVRLAALCVLGDHIDLFPSALHILTELLSDPDDQIRIHAAGLVGTGLQRVLPPEVIFDHFAQLDPIQFWEVHQTLPLLFRLQREWFLETPAAQQYLVALFARQDLPEVVREQAIDAVCRLLPYKDPQVWQIIMDAIEDDDPWIRGTGRELRDGYLLKDRVVRNAQQAATITE